jgi:hypothetical protein
LGDFYFTFFEKVLSSIPFVSRESRYHPSYYLLLAPSKGSKAFVFSLSLADGVVDKKRHFGKTNPPGFSFQSPRRKAGPYFFRQSFSSARNKFVAEESYK